MIRTFTVTVTDWIRRMSPDPQTIVPAQLVDARIQQVRLDQAAAGASGIGYAACVAGDCFVQVYVHVV
jgi:hypothetical protein